MGTDKHTREILSIVALGFLGLCLITGLYRMATKKAGEQATCDKACGAFVFIAVVLMAVVSFLVESEGYEGGDCDPKQCEDPFGTKTRPSGGHCPKGSKWACTVGNGCMLRKVGRDCICTTEVNKPTC